MAYWSLPYPTGTALMLGFLGNIGWAWTCRAISTSSLDVLWKSFWPNPALSMVETKCFFGGHGAFALSLRFLLEEKLPRGRFKEFLLWLLYTNPMRLIASPYFYLVDRLGRGAIITVVCVKRESAD